MLQLISKLFGGSKSEKDVKKIQYLVPIINSHFEGYKALSNEALREKTPEFKARIKAHLSAMDAQIESEQARAEALPMSELMGRDTIYQDIDKIKKDRDQAIEAILWDILPEAFAVVKEAARRFTEAEQLVSKATQLDRDLSVRKEYISIMGEDSVFETTWKNLLHLICPISNRMYSNGHPYAKACASICTEHLRERLNELRGVLLRFEQAPSATLYCIFLQPELVQTIFQPNFLLAQNQHFPQPLKWRCMACSV